MRNLSPDFHITSSDIQGKKKKYTIFKVLDLNILEGFSSYYLVEQYNVLATEYLRFFPWKGYQI